MGRSVVFSSFLLILLGIASPVQASPLVALTAAQTVLGLIKSFSSGDGGLGAMLQTQLQYLEVISGQLQSIRVALKDLIIAVNKITDTTRQFMSEQYRDELLNSIEGALDQYILLYDGSARLGDQFWEKPVEKDRLWQIGEELARCRSMLSVSPLGRGPEASLIAGPAAAMELATLARRGATPDLMLATLRRYDKWLTDAVSDSQANSIRAYGKEARGNVRAALGKLYDQDTTWGKRFFPIEEFLATIAEGNDFIVDDRDNRFPWSPKTRQIIGAAYPTAEDGWEDNYKGYLRTLRHWHSGMGRDFYYQAATLSVESKKTHFLSYQREPDIVAHGLGGVDVPSGQVPEDAWCLTVKGLGDWWFPSGDINEARAAVWGSTVGENVQTDEDEFLKHIDTHNYESGREQFADHSEKVALITRETIRENIRMLEASGY